MARRGDRTLVGNFIDPEAIGNIIADAKPSPERVRAVLAKARELHGLASEEVAVLLSIEDPELEKELLATAGEVKEAIYGHRLVLFAPLYIGNKCSNDCLYCAFRAPNTSLKRRSLSLDEIELETRALLREGHKRVLMLSGESSEETVDRLVAAIERVYSVREPAPRSGKPSSIRRINVEVAPLEVEEFARLKAAHIGTYACFQETYDPRLYSEFHKKGPKADYENRLFVMDRAMEGGIDDVGIGALFGLGDFRFEVLGMMAHAAHLEAKFGCGPHTVSVPRIEPAEGTPLAARPPRQLSDHEFRRVVASLRLALPYTGIILSTREGEDLRNELFRYGVSQISAGSRTNPGAYAEDASEDGSAPAAEAAEAGRPSSMAGSQFQLGDHRSLAEVVDKLGQLGYVPSFCTGCYRKGRVGADFMDLAKPGLIKRFCEPNALFTFAEYLEDFASAEERARGLARTTAMIQRLPDEETMRKAREGLAEVATGARDVYL
ncbi:MAG TPA: [FeFe] hydrogenase H-cluster radical SAM maturase HydG [Rectinemataceae bacterium]|nr:[FeFe] hydrogenase H-cluster radical SAM maturase HydG [Rectinemataceae bacterium]